MNATLLPRSSLTSAQRAAMLAILDANFSNVTPEQFSRDLAEKNWVILIHDEAGHLVGFTTLLLYRASIDAREIAVIYSGDTIIQRQAWGSPALARTWLSSVWKLHAAECPHLPLYWLLLTAGFRTYRFLTVFWREFYPCHSDPTPPQDLQILRQLARTRFGSLFDEPAGVVHLAQPLRTSLLGIPDERKTDPHIAFFSRQNPGFTQGDELVCITHMTPQNLTPAGQRMNLPPVATPLHSPTPAVARR